MVYVISGHLKFSCRDEEFEARAGDSFVVSRPCSERPATAAIGQDSLVPRRPGLPMIR